MDLVVDCSVLRGQDLFPTNLKDTGQFYKALLLRTLDTKIATIPKGEKRIEYIKSPDFFRTIKEHGYCLYNPKKNICVMDPKVALKFSDIFPKGSVYWTNVEHYDDDMILRLAQVGFCHPYFAEKTPDGRECKGIALFKLQKQFDPQVVLYKVKGLTQPDCKLVVRFSKAAVKFLKNLPYQGHTKGKDGKISQKELAGEMVVQGADERGYIIGVDEGSIASGEEEDVSVKIVRYNFHSHPKEAYDRHSVKHAWPSVIDFLGFVKLGKNTIFHTVVTIEGVYILSFGQYWAKHSDKIKKSFIQEHFNIPHPKTYSETHVQTFLSKVNSIKLENEPVFRVIFLNWNKATTPFDIFFSPLGQTPTCLVSQDLVNVHKEIIDI